MTVIDLTAKNYEEITSSENIVLVDAWAPWCGPCRGFAPVFEAVAKEHPDLVFGKLNTQEEADLRNELGIQYIPTLMVYRDGILLYKDAESPPREVLEELIRQAVELDMDEVRARRAREAEESKAGEGGEA